MIVAAEYKYGRSSGISGYEDLQVWQKSHALAVEIFKITEAFLRSRRFELASQLHRASLSVPTNIAEGYGSKHRKEFLQFLNISTRLLHEVRYLLFFSSEVGLLDRAGFERLRQESVITEKMLGSLIKAIEKRLT